MDIFNMTKEDFKKCQKEADGQEILENLIH